MGVSIRIPEYSSARHGNGHRRVSQWIGEFSLAASRGNSSVITAISKLLTEVSKQSMKSPASGR